MRDEFIFDITMCSLRLQGV